MKRFIKSLALGILLALPWTGVSAQQVNLYCWVDAGPPVHWSPCNSTNPVPISGSISITFPTIGAAVPSTGVYNGINVAGTLRGLSGLSTGSLFPATVAIVDANGNQITTFGSAAVGTTGAAVPASADYIGINIAGTLTGWTGVLQPGENHCCEVGGNILPITNAMTTSNATVTTGQSIGGIQTLANAVRVSGSLGASGTSGIIQSAVLTFLDAVGSGPLDIYFYNATVTTGSNCANATTFVLQTADRPNVLGIAHVTDFTASNTAAVAQANNLAIPFGLASGTSLFACVVARGSFAITGTSNASIKVNVLRN